MNNNESILTATDDLSPWWRRAVVIVMVFGFSILILLTSKVYYDAPPIPERVIDNKEHGAYLGPDFSAQYLHNLTEQMSDFIAQQRYKKLLIDLENDEQDIVRALVRSSLKKNSYDLETNSLVFTEAEIASYYQQIIFRMILMLATYLLELHFFGALPVLLHC